MFDASRTIADGTIPVEAPEATSPGRDELELTAILHALSDPAQQPAPGGPRSPLPRAAQQRPERGGLDTHARGAKRAPPHRAPEQVVAKRLGSLRPRGASPRERAAALAAGGDRPARGRRPVAGPS